MTAPSLQQYIQGQGAVSADNLNTFEQTCDTIAQLRAFIGLPGMQVFIRGFTTPNDGGAGPFYWNATSTATDNGTTVVRPSGVVIGAWLRLNIAASLVSGSIGTLLNIAALRASVSGSPVLFVEGYFTGADGGEGIFWLNPTDTTSADNGGTIIIDGLSHRYYRETSGAPYNALWFGAIGDNATDNTASMNSAHATGRVIYYPQGIYKFTTLNPFVSGGITGEGDNITFLSSTDTSSADLISWVSGSNVPEFRNFALVAPINGSSLPVKAAGVGIHFTTTGGAQLVRGFFENVSIAGVPTSVAFDAGGLVNFYGCTFALFSSEGAHLQNVVNGDNGGGTFTNCFFNSSAGRGITWNSGGDLRLTSCVMLGMQGLGVDLKSNTNTTILLIEGCSMETTPATGIQNIAFARSSGTATLGLITITGSEFRSNATFGIQVGSGGVFYDMAITGNTFLLENGGGAINLFGVSGFTISGNTIRALAGSATAITTDATCVNGKIGPNAYTAVNPVNNASSTVFIDTVQEHGTNNVTTSTALGALFAGSLAVTFAAPFLVAPVVNTNTTSTAGGGISAQAGSITTTGFVLTAVGATNGGSVNCAWTAQGVA